jgi:Dimethlysulfonioproprionate lyase
MRTLIVGAAVMIGLWSPDVEAAAFKCQDNVPHPSYSADEQKLVDQFWTETLAYLDAYLNVLKTPTGACKDSAEATIQTFDAATGAKQSRCILKYRDMELMAKHLQAILAEPEKAKACFDPQKSYTEFQLYTPNAKLQSMSPVSQWLDRPLLTEYFAKMGGPIGKAGLELNENFVDVVSKTDTQAHWKRDVSINGLPNLWASVGWIPFYAENENARNDRFRGGYLYAEVMGPWGNLRIAEIDGEPVGAEIGMTAQLFNSSYPFHYHHPQEIYMTLTKPQCIDQNKYMVMDWDSGALHQERVDGGWSVTVDGADGAWKTWFKDQDPTKEWLSYFERNAIHAFYLKEGCNATIENSGLVTVWARSTARDNQQSTRLCRPTDGTPHVNDMMPWTKAVCDLKDWTP